MTCGNSPWAVGHPPPETLSSLFMPRCGRRPGAGHGRLEFTNSFVINKIALASPSDPVPAMLFWSRKSASLNGATDWRTPYGIQVLRMAFVGRTDQPAASHRTTASIPNRFGGSARYQGPHPIKPRPGRPGVGSYLPRIGLRSWFVINKIALASPSDPVPAMLFWSRKSASLNGATDWRTPYGIQVLRMAFVGRTDQPAASHRTTASIPNRFGGSARYQGPHPIKPRPGRPGVGSYLPRIGLRSWCAL